MSNPCCIGMGFPTPDPQSPAHRCQETWRACQHFCRIPAGVSVAVTSLGACCHMLHFLCQRFKHICAERALIRSVMWPWYL